MVFKILKKKKNPLLFILLIVILCRNFSYIDGRTVFATYENNRFNPYPHQKVVHSPILITSDADFGPSGYNFPGYGNETHPFIIENYEITTTEQSAISITNAHVNFIIRNCELTAEGYGIYVFAVAPGITEIRDNYCYESIQGIILEYAQDSIIVNNTCTNNYSYSISTHACYGSIIANNTCSGSSYGVIVIFPHDTVIANNSFSNEGLDVFGSTLNDFLTCSVYNNTANGKLIGFFTSIQDVVLNVSIYNQLFLINATKCTVENQMMQNSLRGISLFFCTNSTVKHNTLNHLGYAGASIFVYKSTNTIIEDNSISAFEIGIHISNGCYNTTIIDNTCSYCGWGAYVSGNFTLVQENTVQNNMYGLNFVYTEFVKVNNNVIKNNDIYGIEFRHTENSNITNNLIQGNDNYAVYLDDESYNNNIHHNNFISNRLTTGSQAYDDGTENYWYDTSTLEGNVWDDLGTRQSYLVDGLAASRDLYPLNALPVPEFQEISVLLILIGLIGILSIVSVLKKKKERT